MVAITLIIFYPWFIVMPQLGPSNYSGSSPCAGLQEVTQSTHLLKDCYPYTVKHNENQALMGMYWVYGVTPIIHYL